MRRPINFRTKTIFALLLISLLPIFGISVILLNTIYDALQEKSLTHISSIANSKKSRLSHAMKSIGRQVSNLRHELESSLKMPLDFRDIAAQIKVQSTLEQIVQSDIFIEQIDVISTNGKVVSSRGRQAGEQFSALETSQNIDLAPRFEKFVFQSGKLMLLFTAPLLYGDQLQGMTHVYAHGGWINKIASDYNGYDSTGETLIAVKDKAGGSPILISPVNLQPNKMSPLSLPVAQNPINFSVSGVEDNFAKISDYRGQLVVASTRSIPEYGLGLVTKASYSEVFQPLNSKMRLVILILIAVTLCMILLGYFITRPLLQLASVAEKAVQGDYPEPLEIKSKDEVNTLASSLYQLITKLKESNQKLAKKTRDFAQLNQSLEEKVKERALAVSQKKEQLELITDSIPALIAYVDAEQNYQFNNAVYEEWFGQGRQAIKGKSLYEVFPVKSLHKIQPHIDKLVATKKPVQYKTTVVHRSKGEIPVEVHYIPHLSAKGELMGFFSLVYDISQKLKEEKELAMCAAIVNSSLDAIFSCSPRGEILTWNAAAERIYGWTAEEAIGKKAIFLVPDSLREESARLFRDLIRHKKSVEAYETVSVRKDKSDVEISLTAFPILGDDKKVKAISICARDITARKQAEHALNQYMEQLRQKNLEIEQFVYTVSHDLKTPLVTIQSFLGFLQEDIAQEDWDSTRDAIERIKNAGKRMRELIDDILEVSRLGRQTLDCQSLNLNDLVVAVKDELSEHLDDKESIQIDQPLPTVYADPRKLKQIFENLLHNAIKYGRAPASSLQVNLGYRDQGQEFHFYVKDSGPGIALEDQERIFRLFQRLNSSTHAGTGIGLAIVDKLVQLHNGRVWVESEPGHGATFWFSLPKSLTPSS